MIQPKVDEWLTDILCDPLDKSRLKVERECLRSSYGRQYPIVDGVYDLRALCSHAGVVGKQWQRGQADFESWSARIADGSHEDHAAQRRGLEDVYAAIPLAGRCLDVGGSDGRLRAFLSQTQQYVSVDPYLAVLREPRPTEFERVYPFMAEPLNFIAALAEHLPFLSQSFDVVHMRSVIDHFVNPELALREAFRVLRKDGSLIVGLTVEGGKTGRNSMRTQLKKSVKAVASVAFRRFGDHHIWHPTYHELCELIAACGFRVDRTHLQETENDQVCYIQAAAAKDSSTALDEGLLSSRDAFRARA